MNLNQTNLFYFLNDMNHGITDMPKAANDNNPNVSDRWVSANTAELDQTASIK